MGLTASIVEKLFLLSLWRPQ